MKKIWSGGKVTMTKVSGATVLSPLAWRTVPCGKCAFCLMNRRSSWMFRIHHEMRNQMYPGWFLTLTYNEKFVPRTEDGRLSLRFRDVQLYLKRIRKAKYYAKYICVGEYGGETHRPHYHMLLWTDAPALWLEKNWFYGHIQFGTLTMASAMYTLKYIIQPKQQEDNGLEKTRAQFSKGLGLSYLTDAVYRYHTDDFENPNMFSIIDGRRVALPRYYKSKIFTKTQMFNYGKKAKKDSTQERRKLMRSLIAQGVVGPGPDDGQRIKRYIDGLRAEQCQRIIEKTKFGTSL